MKKKSKKLKKKLSQISWDMIFFGRGDYFYLFIAAGVFFFKLNYIFRFSVQVRHYSLY